MKKYLKSTSLSPAVAAGRKGQSKPNGSDEQKNSGKVKRSVLAFMCVVLMALTGMKEMEKGKDEDALQEQTLKTLEVINIADIKIEKQNLEKQINALYAK